MRKFLSLFAFMAIVLTFAACNNGGNEGNIPEVNYINGIFSVGNGQQVYFAKGNLQATTTDLGAHWSWGFAPNQYDRIGDKAANNAINGDGTVSENGTVDLFGWSTPSTTNGIHNSIDNSTYSGNFRNWGERIGAGWYTLSADQWEYLFMTRTDAKKLFGFGTIKMADNTKIKGLFILPDNWDDAKRAQFNFRSAEDVNLEWEEGNGKGRYINLTYPNEYAVTGGGITWAAMQAEGVVFLPFSFFRKGETVTSVGGCYWSSTPSNTDGQAIYVFFSTTFFYPHSESARRDGQAVRLVRNAN